MPITSVKSRSYVSCKWKGTEEKSLILSPSKKVLNNIFLVNLLKTNLRYI